MGRGEMGTGESRDIPSPPFFGSGLIVPLVHSKEY